MNQQQKTKKNYNGKKNRKYLLPQDTYEIIIKTEIKNIDNFSLRLNKLAYFDNNKFEFFKRGDKRTGRLEVLPNYDCIKFQEIAEKHKKAIKEVWEETKEVILATTWKMVIGLGNESVFETSMALHHIYGIPYIPGSAIKGITRSYINEKVFEKKVELDDNKKNLEKQIFYDIFGHSKESHSKGKIIFFDAFPIKKPTLEPDIMTPHYNDYYSDEVPPVDYLNTIPIPFLIVKNTEFQFIIGAEKKEDEKLELGEINGNLLEITYQWMKEALQEHGIGAKTAVGYGYLSAKS